MRKREIQNEIEYYELKTKCDAMLMGLLGRQELVDRWWDGPNLHWGLRHPIDIFNSGSEGRRSVYRYLGDHCFGGAYF